MSRPGSVPPDADRYVALLAAVETLLIMAAELGAVVGIAVRPPPVPKMQTTRPASRATNFLAGLPCVLSGRLSVTRLGSQRRPVRSVLHPTRCRRSDPRQSAGGPETSRHP